MAAFSAAEMQDGLRNKGFVRHDDEPLSGRQEKRDADHYLFYFHFEGKRTAIRTKISRGSKYVYDDRGLLPKVAIQLKLNLGQLKRLIRCPLKIPEYVEILRRQGKLNRGGAAPSRNQAQH